MQSCTPVASTSAPEALSSTDDSLSPEEYFFAEEPFRKMLVLVIFGYQSINWF